MEHLKDSYNDPILHEHVNTERESLLNFLQKWRCTLTNYAKNSTLWITPQTSLSYIRDVGLLSDSGHEDRLTAESVESEH